MAIADDVRALAERAQCVAKDDEETARRLLDHLFDRILVEERAPDWFGAITVARAFPDVAIRWRDAENRYSLLHFAARTASVDYVVFLISMGIEIDTLGQCEVTPLTLVCGHHDGPDVDRLAVARILLHNGASTKNRTCRRLSPIIVAAQSGHTEIVRLICQFDRHSEHLLANMEWSPIEDDQQGEILINPNNALLVAFLDGNREMSKVLIQYGALAIFSDDEDAYNLLLNFNIANNVGIDLPPFLEL